MMEKNDQCVDPKHNCHEAGTWFMKGGKERQKNRGKTFPGIARAMAEQWAGQANSGMTIKQEETTCKD